MHEAVPIVRPLQNHLPDDTHLTTAAAFAIPQYLHQFTAAQLMIILKELLPGISS